MKRFPYRIEDLPTETFFAILKPKSVTIPGDERSRTNPGHGYPEHSEDSWDMEVFPNENAWKEEIQKITQDNLNSYYKTKFIPVKITPAQVKVDVNIGVE